MLLRLSGVPFLSESLDEFYRFPRYFAGNGTSKFQADP